MTLRTGFIAARILDTGGVGRVVAVFQRSAYIAFDDQLLCAAPPSLCDGPLMVRLQNFPTFCFGDEYTLPKAPRSIWRPPVPYGWTGTKLSHGLAAVRSAGKGREPAEGLARFALEEDLSKAYGSQEAKAAHMPIARLQEWLLGMFEGVDFPVPVEANALIGLGPGLTPSGDDFLGGAMVAAHSVGRSDIAAHLYQIVLSGKAGTISAAHLAAASEGAASAPLHLLLNDILCDRVANLSVRLHALNTMGHSSGWDAFAGVMAVLRAAVRSEEFRTQAA